MVVAATLPDVGYTRQAVEELSRRRGEPAWLLALRLDAFETYERLPLEETPTGNWRRTSIKGLDLDRQALPSEPKLQAQAPEGFRVVDLAEAARDGSPYAELVRRHFGQVVSAAEDKLTALHYALFNAGSLVVAPRNAVSTDPVVLEYEVASPGQAAFVHTLVVADESAEVSVVDRLSSSAGTAAGAPAPVNTGVVEIVAGPNANVRYVQIQDWATDAWAFSFQRSTLAADAWVRMLNVALGGRQVRNTVQTVLNGKGSQADLLGVVAGTGRQHVDFQTLQDHHGDATRSDLVIHNGLYDRASSNFTGLIRINPESHGTESSQEQKNVLLSDGAKADSDPKLEILNNDVVRCTHGAAVGPMDEEMVFYLQARGLTRDEATSLVLEGFFRSVVDKLARPEVEAIAWAAVQRKLGGA